MPRELNSPLVHPVSSAPPPLGFTGWSPQKRIRDARSTRAFKPGARIVDMAVPPAWMAEGVCSNGDHDPDLWFADPHSPDGMLAKELCFSCPMLLTCRAYAAHSNEGGFEESGIWGGGDFNADWTRCENGHWEAPGSRNKNDECRGCMAARQRKRRLQAA